MSRGGGFQGRIEIHLYIPYDVALVLPFTEGGP